MSKIAVVYWSGTGNTEAMANAVADGVNENGGNATLYTADSFNGDMVNDFDAIAFGCPAMGDAAEKVPRGPDGAPPGLVLTILPKFEPKGCSSYFISGI